MLKENEEKRVRGRKLTGTFLIVSGIAVFLFDIPFLIFLFIINDKQLFNHILIPNAIVISIGVILIISGLYLHRNSKKTSPSAVSYTSNNLWNMDFDQFYEMNIKKHEKKYHEADKNVKPKVMIIGGIIILLCLISIVFFNQLLITLLSIVIGLITLLFCFIKPLSFEIERQLIIVDALKKSLDYIEPNIEFTYQKRNEIYLNGEIIDDYNKDISESKIFKDGSFGKEYTCAINNGNFYLSLYEMSYMTGYDNDFKVVCFKGTFLKTYFHKNTNPILILPIVSNYKESRYNDSSLSKIDILIEGYNVYASDENEARNIITPKFIEQFISLTRYYNKKAALSLYNNNVYIAFEEMNYFDEKSEIIKKGITKETVLEMINEIKRLINIDEEIFKK